MTPAVAGVSEKKTYIKDTVHMVVCGVYKYGENPYKKRHLSSAYYMFECLMKGKDVQNIPNLLCCVTITSWQEWWNWPDLLREQGRSPPCHIFCWKIWPKHSTEQRKSSMVLFRQFSQTWIHLWFCRRRRWLHSIKYKRSDKLGKLGLCSEGNTNALKNKKTAGGKG